MASKKNHLFVVPNKNRLYVTVYPNDDAPEDKERYLAEWGKIPPPKSVKLVSFVQVSAKPNRARESSFSWGFLVGPKNEDKVINPGTRYHIHRVPTATEDNPGGFRWRYVEAALPSISRVERMYARILIAKIENDDRLELLLRETPRPRAVENDPVATALHESYGSHVWVAQVLEKLASMDKKNRVVGRSAVLDWPLIERKARRYVTLKMATDRYDESYLQESGCLLPKPCWDMLLDREITP